MKKRRLGVLLPIAAMLLSGCAFIDFVKDLFGISQKEEEKPQPKPEQKETLKVPDVLRLTLNEPQEIPVEAGLSTTKFIEITYTPNKLDIVSIINNTIKGIKVGQDTIDVYARTEKGAIFNTEFRVVVSEEGKTKLDYTYDDYNVHNVYAYDNCPLSGNPKLLIIPVWFSDSNEFINVNKKESVREDIRKTILGTSEETGWHSVKTFYEAESFGKLKIQGKVADWYETDDSYLNYVDEGAEELRAQAVDDYFKQNQTEKRKDYDTNEDGYLDGVVFIYAAPDYQNLGYSEMNNLWAYCTWTFDSPNLSIPKMNVLFWGSYDFMYAPGDDAYNKTGMSFYGRGDTDYCEIDSHCFIHEFGHVLGLPDYYDYGDLHSPAGGFSMQDYNVGGHDPYSILAYGWGEAYIPTETTTIKINDFQSSHDVILLANHEVTSPFDEYLLLEFYSPTELNKFDSDYCYRGSYPQGPAEYGIRVWHVDARLVYFDTQSWNWSDTLTSDVNSGYVTQAFSNTSYNPPTTTEDYFYPLGSESAVFNILQLIRSDNVMDENFSKDNMFMDKSTFSMEDYSSQFINETNMNDGQPLGWTFKVNTIEDSVASIKVIKL